MFFRYKLPHRRKVVHLVIFHSSPQFVFQITPRERGEFQVVFKYLFKRFVAEHNLLRKCHIRYCRCLFLAHSTADHINDRAGIDKPTVAHFVMIEPRIRYFLAEHIEQHKPDYYPHPHGNRSERHGQIKTQLVHLPIDIDYIERYNKVKVIRQKFKDNCARIKVEQPQAQPRRIIRLMCFYERPKPRKPLFDGAVCMNCKPLKRF